MKVLLLSMAFDIAGQGAALSAALRRWRPGWSVDQMARLEKSYAYPQQQRWNEQLARRLYQQADVVHLTETLLAHRKFGARPTVIHHHGTRYRDNRDEVDAAVRSAGAVAVASTLDLTGPEVEWLPVVADLDALAHLRAVEYEPGPIRLAHSPTDPAVKGTDIIRSASRFPLDVITGVTWSECLRRKARADIFVDQLELGYGLSAVEAWGMGIPVVSGVSDPDTKARMIDEFGELPFVDATPETLADRIADLAGSPALRREWGERGRAHAERFHSQRAVVERLAPIYTSAWEAVAA